MEKATLLGFSAISGILGGTLGTVATLWLARPSPRIAGVSSSSSAVVQSESRDSSLSDRVSALESEVRGLQQRRVSQLAAALAATAQAQAGSAAPAASTVVDDPVFEAAVRDVVTRAEQERAAEEQTKRDERWRTRARNYADELVPKLNLTPQQKDQISEITFAHWDTLRKSFEADAAGGQFSREKRREQAQKVRAESEAKLQQVLDPRQMANYQRLEDNSKIGALGVGQRRPP